MTNSVNIPSNRNFLSPLGFKFVLARAPNLNYNVQTVVLPDLTLGTVERPTPFVPIPLEGNLQFGDLSVTFKVDEDLANYKELQEWMVGLGGPESFDQYKALSDASKAYPMGSGGLYSDISVTILSSASRPNVSFRFLGCLPTALSGLQFTSTDTSVAYVDATASFRFIRYVIETT